MANTPFEIFCDQPRRLRISVPDDRCGNDFWHFSRLYGIHAQARPLRRLAKNGRGRFLQASVKFKKKRSCICTLDLAYTVCVRKGQFRSAGDTLDAHGGIRTHENSKLVKLSG